MTMRLSTGLRNFLAKEGGLGDALSGGIIEIYTGPQPASADAAPTGTLLCTITSAGATVTPEVLATGTVTLTGGASGSVGPITVNGVDILGGATVPFNSTLAQTASDIATAINRAKTAPEYTATASGATVTISALPGTGASVNGFVVSATTATITATTGNMAGGVNGANGLKFDPAVGGVLSKQATQTWSGTNAATGSAGWFRQYGSVADPKTVDSAGTTIRLDGAIATSGAEMNLNSTALTTGAVTTLANWSMLIPAQ
jgi:hypothetical protein